MNKLILQPEYPGLGDHLFYSHIPRIAIETGVYDRVFISRQAQFRHPDICKLVWEMNPYISGFVDEPGEAPPVAPPSNKEENLLDQMMFSFGLDDGRRWHEPEIYYEPNVIPEYANFSLYDPNFITNAGSLINGKRVASFFEKNKIRIDIHMKSLSNRSVCLPRYDDKNALSTSLFQFVNTLFSCSSIYCLATGTATLCSALNKNATVFYSKEIKEMFLHSKNNRYILLEPTCVDKYVNKLKKKIDRLVELLK